MGDVEFDEKTGCITHLIVPGPGCLCGIFGREREYVIPFCDVKQIGDDIILVEIRTLKDVNADEAWFVLRNRYKNASILYAFCKKGCKLSMGEVK